MYSPPALNTWIMGDSEESEVAETAKLYDPNDGRPVQAGRSSSERQVERAIAAAQRVHDEGSWQELGVEGRAKCLDVFARALDPHLGEMATLDAVNSGVPVRFTTAFAQAIPDVVRHAGRLALEQHDQRQLPADPGPVHLHRVPWGPTALIIPWNVPATLMVKKMAFALAAGAPVVIKPSSASPWSAQLIARAAMSAFPAGVVSVVMGSGAVGGRLCADPRIKAIAMTGSTATGRSIARASADNLTRLRLELGSINPVIVRHDADVEAAALSLFEGMTKLNGQWCEAPRTVFVHHSRHQELNEALAAHIEAAVPGSSLDERTSIGPMAFEARRRELLDQTQALIASGGQLIAKANTPETGWFFGPSLVTGCGHDPDSEIFGPLLLTEAVASDDEALQRANRVEGGLAGYVFSRDVEGALRIGARMRAGEVKINGTSLLDMSPESEQSFFGVSGIGGHGDHTVLDFFAGAQVVGHDLVSAPV